MHLVQQRITSTYSRSVTKVYAKCCVSLESCWHWVMDDGDAAGGKHAQLQLKVLQSTKLLIVFWSRSSKNTKTEKNNSPTLLAYSITIFVSPFKVSRTLRTLTRIRRIHLHNRQIDKHSLTQRFEGQETKSQRKS